MSESPILLPLLSEPPDLAPAAPDDLDPMWSVTTLISALDKPALVPWTAIKTAECAIDQERVWKSRLEHEGRDAAIDYLKGARFRRARGARSATALGTAVHAACEYKAIFGSWRQEDLVDMELRPFLVQFDRFLDAFQPTYIAAEVTVFHPATPDEPWAYAGTCDGFFEL